MKNLSILVILLFILNSCKLPTYTLGMTEAQFKKEFKGADLVEASSVRTVYKDADSVGAGGKLHYLYYYFINYRLDHIDQGERQPYVVIEHTNH